MNDLTYYTKAINDCRETQCQSDLLNGKIKIADVPFAFRGHDEYAAAHKYARGLVDEKERYYLYWKIAESMESDMVNLQAAVDGELPVSKEAGFLRNQSKDTGFEPAGSLFSCLSG